MSTSETPSEIIASDEEDYKSNIPYKFDNEPITAAPSPFGTLENTEKNINSSFDCHMWENDDGFMDDNLSALDVVDYNASHLTDSSLRTSAIGMLTDVLNEKSCQHNRTGTINNSFTQSDLSSQHYFPTTDTASTAATSRIIDDASIEGKETPASHLYNENFEEDIKFSPTELIHPPPSALKYDYNTPLPPSLVHPMLPPPSHGHLLPPMQQGINTHKFVYPPPPTKQSPHSQTQYDQYPHHTSGYQPTMWYPNASYGASSGYYRSYSGQRYSNYGTYSSDPMLDMLQLSNSGREARNRAEKNRRDKLNGCIQELSTMVPHVAESQRRVDKTTILRCATHGLRLVYTFGKSQSQSRPQYTDALMKLVDRFFMAITCNGEIVLVSSSVEQHLGHCQIDLYGQNILNITHPEDHSIMKKQLIPTDLDDLFHTPSGDDPNDSEQRTKEEEEYIDQRLRADKRSFTVRLARAGPRSEPTTYEIVKIEGNFRRSDAAPRGKKVNTFPSTLQMIRRSRGRDDTISLHTISGNDIVLIATARVIRLPKVINNVSEPNAMKYKTRHLIDGRIIDCDQGIGLVAGYMTQEVQNLSPFTFMHQDDVRWVIVALRQMYDCKSSFGESTYRLITRNGHFIYLNSKGFLEIDKDTQQVRSFICVNTLLDEEEGKRKVQEMKKKFSMIVNTKIPQSSVDEPASNNPQQLEKAVLCLIQNLQKSPDAEDDDDGDSSIESYTSEFMSPPCEPATSVTAIQHRSSIASPSVFESSMQAAAFHLGRQVVKTPPLALVPPEPESVKTSITKSVNVVNVTAAKYLRSNQPEKNTDSFDCETNIVTYDSFAESNIQDTLSNRCVCDGTNAIHCSNCQASNKVHNTSVSPAFTIVSTSTATTANKRGGELILSDELELPTKRLRSTEIEHALTSSLDQLGKTLDQQLNAAIELRDKSNIYEMPNSNHRINEIMEEHQMQSKIYIDIKSEFEVQKHNKIIDANTTRDIIRTPTLSPLGLPCNQQESQQMSREDNIKPMR